MMGTQMTRMGRMDADFFIGEVGFGGFFCLKDLGV
jgi:hypothetical protein